MMKDITLGQFFPGNSCIHKLDPRAKFCFSIMYIVAVFLANSYIAYATILAFSILLVLLSRVSLRVVLKGIRGIIFIMLFTAILSIFFTKGTAGESALVDFAFIHIYRSGIERAIFMIIRIVSLIMGTSVLISYTTSPIRLTDAIEDLFSPLNKIHVPVHDFAMMMSIALRFIPTFVEETDKIMQAQKSRGADFQSGGLVRRAKSLLPIIIPLFLSAFRRADELATAMECRCYRGGDGRTKMIVLKFHLRDLFFALVFVALIVGIVLLNHYFPLG